MIKLNNLPSGIIKVENPDHPFTYDGPDILLSDRKGLLAIFYLRENEQKNVNKLFARTTNALIAYPPYTKMLFLYNYKKETPNSIIQFGKLYFDDLIEIKDIKKSKSIMKDKKSEKRIENIRYYQKKIFAIQSRIQRNNMHYINSKKFNRKEILDISYLKENAKKVQYFDKVSQKEVVTRANIFEHQNRYYGVKKLRSSKSDLVELQPYFEFVINSEFNVDNGVPYYDISNKVLNLNEIPMMKFDPFKPTRIASLFGWYIVNSKDFYQLENRLTKHNNYGNSRR